MSDNSSSSIISLSTNTKLIFTGAVTVAAIVFSYFTYTRYIKKKRSESSSSGSEDDTALIKYLKGPKRGANTIKKNSRNIKSFENNN
jgi:hypothetical protein